MKGRVTLVDYTTLDNLLVGRNRTSKKLGNNTYAVRVAVEETAGIVIRLHQTDIMKFYPDTSLVKLNTGGWRTVTTKQRLNEYLPTGWYIAQDKGLWYVCWAGKRIALFNDGMTVNSNGGMAGTGGLAIDTYGPKIRAEREQAKKYAKDFIAALFVGSVPLPSGGDCWYCCLKDVKTGKPWGDARAEHIHSHMEEAYYVPSLLVNAMEAFGASVIARQVAYDLMSDGKPDSEWLNTVANEQLTKCVYRYVLRQLGHAT